MLKKTIFALTLAIALVGTPVLAVSTQGTLNKLYNSYNKTGDVNTYYEMCGLAVNSNPSDVPSRVMDTCIAGL